MWRGGCNRWKAIAPTLGGVAVAEYVDVAGRIGRGRLCVLSGGDRGEMGAGGLGL